MVMIITPYVVVKVVSCMDKVFSKEGILQFQWGYMILIQVLIWRWSDSWFFLPRSLWITGKVEITDKSSHVIQLLLEMSKRGVYESEFIKKRQYLPMGVSGNVINK